MIMKKLFYVHAESINILIISRLSIEQGDLDGIRTKIIEVWLTALTTEIPALLATGAA